VKPNNILHMKVKININPESLFQFYDFLRLSFGDNIYTYFNFTLYFRKFWIILWFLLNRMFLMILMKHKIFIAHDSEENSWPKLR
jgi:hypothetical protein